MTTWEWNFFDASVADEGGMKDVVKEINYVLKGTRDDKSFEIGGRTALGKPDKDSFKPFASLSKSDVEAMVAASVSVEALKNQIDAWFDEAGKKKALPFS